MPSLAETLDLATLLHAGQTDYTGSPYVEHVVWVLDQLPHSASLDDQHLALLHDTLEDCKPQISDMLFTETMRYIAVQDPEGLLEFYRHRGYSEYFITGLRLLTRDLWPNVTYMQYIQQIADSGHRGAVLVKDTDNRHNSDPERLNRVLPCYQPRVASLKRRYERSRRLLRPMVMA